MAPYGTNAVSLKVLKRNAWDLGLYAQMQACSGTEGCSKTRVLTSLTLRKLKLTEYSKITTSLTKTSPLMLLREIINYYFHNHTEHTKLWEKREHFFNVKCSVNIHFPLCFKGPVAQGYLSSCNKTPT